MCFLYDYTCLTVPVCENTFDSRFVLSFVGRRTVEVMSGHPRPSLSGTGVPWVSLPGPTGVPQSPGWLCGKVPTLLGVVVGVVAFAFHAHVQLRILTLLLDWKRCFKLSVVVILGAGCGCFLQENS